MAAVLTIIGLIIFHDINNNKFYRQGLKDSQSQCQTKQISSKLCGYAITKYEYCNAASITLIIHICTEITEKLEVLQYK